MDNTSRDAISFQEILESLPKDIMIIDSFQKAHSVLCSGKYKKIACAISGGSDSDVLLDIITKIDTEHIVDYFFFDTGMEYQATKEHLTFLEKKYGITIQKVRARTPVPLAVRKAGYPFLNKKTSEYIHRLQIHNFQWEDDTFENLIKKYPHCDSALRWWTNSKSESGSSQHNINQNKWLKEFLIANPPTFHISQSCCGHAKKHNLDKMGYELVITGMRKAEGGARAGLTQCFFPKKKEADPDKYNPIFWYKKAEKEAYEEYAEICHSRCYTEYGLQRTGCAGCPFGRHFEYELEVLKQYEPKLYKAACNIFAEPYEYTRKYRQFCKEQEEKLRLKKKDMEKNQIGYQYTIFDITG